MYLKTDGIVLRQVDYKDADQILTVLTKQYGLMTLRAKGVRRGSSAIRSACQLLTYSEFTVFENKGFHTIREAVILEPFSELRKDIELLSLASYFAQAAEVLSQEDTPDSEILPLTLNALYALCKLNLPQRFVKAVFEFRLACLAGYMPSLDGCTACGKADPDRFDVTGGTLVCSSCPSSGLRLPLGAGTLTAMRYIASCDRKKLFSFRLEDDSLAELSDIAETYLVTQLERGFYTLDFYKSLLLG